METITKHIDGDHFHTVGNGFLGHSENFIDFRTDPVLDKDVIHALRIPKNTFVFKVILYVLDPESAPLPQINIGDDEEVWGWGVYEDVSLSGLGAICNSESDIYGTGKLYTEDSTINIKAKADLDDCALMIQALYASPALPKEFR